MVRHMPTDGTQPVSSSLVLNSQRSVTEPARRCPNARSGLRARNGTTLAPIACKRRDCPVCGPRKDRELARVLLLDARQEPPTHALTLTTAKPWEQLDPADYRKGSAAVFKRLRRRLGRCEYFGMVEFTTGEAPTSGGHRRMHSHNLLKLGGGGINALEVEQLVRQTWQASTGAYIVEVAALVSAGAALGYLALHHRKPQQAAPRGWRGMVERHSLRYFSEPMAEAIAWASGIPIEDAKAEARSQAWELRSFYEPLNDGSVIEPLGEQYIPLGSERSDWVMRKGRFVNRHTGEVW